MQYFPLVALVAFFQLIEGQVNSWSYPLATVSSNDSSQSPVFRLGTSQNLRWSTDYPTISLCLSIPDDDPKTLLDDVPSINEYTWTVNPYCDDCDVPDLPDTFRLYIVNTADSSARFYSPEFRISEVAVSSSISSAALPTLSGSSTTISIRTATVSIGPMPSTSSAEPSPSVAPLKIGLGVGLGVGIPLLLLVGILICLGLRRKKATYVSNSRTLQKQKNKSTSLSKDDNPYGIAVQ